MTEQAVGVMTVNSSSYETVLQITNDDTNYDHNVKVEHECEPKKKKKKSTNILKVALMLLRQRSRKPNVVVNNSAIVDHVGSKGMWNRLVGAMRPLHLQSDESTTVPSLPAASTEPPLPRLPSSPSLDNFEDVNSSSSSVDGMSRFLISFSFCTTTAAFMIWIL